MIREVNFAKKAARRLQLLLLRRAVALVEIEPDLAGFAIVAWDHRGCVTTSLHTADGPISDAMLPTYLSDVLNRRVAVEDAIHRINGCSDNTSA